MKIKNLKRVTALLLAGTMVFGVAGCGKKEKKTKEEKLDIYDVKMEAQFNVCMENAKVVDNVLYATYYNWNENAISESAMEEQGLIVYDFSTKEQNQVKVEMKDTYLSDFYVDSDKNIVVNANKTIMDEEAIEEDDDWSYQYSEVELIYNQNLECISTKEGEIKTFDATSSVLSEDEMVVYTEYDSENRIYSLCVKYGADSEEYYIKVSGQDGNEIANIKLDEMAERLVRMNDGRVLCMMWGDEGTAIYEIDVEAGKLGKMVAEFEDGYVDGIYAGKDDSILLNENGYLKRLDCSTGKTEKILKFMDSDILAENILLITEFDNGEFGVILRDYESNESEIDRLTKRDENSNTVEKEEIHLGVLYLDSDLQSQVVKFNKLNDKYRIIIDEYMPYSDEDDYDEALKKFNAALTSGNCPDIIDLSAISIEEYAQKGVLESLETYLEKDSEINEDIFVQSILNAYKVDGKIYTIPSVFTLEVFVGATSKVGTDSSWTMKEFVEYAESLPEGVEILSDLTSDGLLGMMLNYSMDEYVDWSTGECNFNSEDFIELLEFCSNYENSEDFYEDYEYEEGSEITKIRNNQVVMRNLYMDSIETYMVEKAVFGEDITIKGFPSKEDNGIVIDTYMPLLGISAKSKYKDVAWEFIKQSYTAETQHDMAMYGLPVRQDQLDELFKQAMAAEVQTDEDGNEYTGIWWFDDLEIKVPAPTEDDIKAIQEMINSADTLGNMNEEIYSMIKEEAEAFFSGQKSAKDVADVIQSRVSIYVKENR